MSTISAQQFEQDPGVVLARVAAGEHLLVTRDGQPIVELRPVAVQSQEPRPFGLCAGMFTVPDDFDDPLPEDLLREFEGR
jgi:antitoxin (DNA-binding transcriptional repressor) of toxin-antitoxin stability system